MTPIPPGPIAVLDACVLHSGVLRDFLIRLAIELTYRPRWTERIHQEWQALVLKRHSHITPARLEVTRQNMERQFEDALVSGHETIAHTYTLPDEGDRHVLAAAVACEAEYIITENLRHFPEYFLEPYAIIALSPDDFAVMLFEQEPSRVITAVHKQRTGLSRPSKEIGQQLSALQNCGLEKLVARLQPFWDFL
jgi:hypothetical protein